MKKIIPVLLLAVVLLGAFIFVTYEPQAAEEPASPLGDAVICSFETTDVNGNKVDSSIFEAYELTMINFWEPWCGPCVAEMPDLQTLQDNYADKGFLLIGVYSTEDGAAEILEDTGVSYPILHYTDDFAYFQTGYVPTSVFVNSKGEMVGSVQIGAKSYEDWAAIVEDLL